MKRATAEEELLAAARADDRTALDELLRLHRNGV
jgi:hypothetical protein